MRTWMAASAVFFVYVMVVALLVRGLSSRRRLLAIGGSVAGLLLTAATHVRPYHPLLHDWVVPPAVLLMAYWTSGLLFAAPMPAAEQVLERFDSSLDIDRLAARTPRWLAELLEFAYFGVYPLIPVALAIHLLATPYPDAGRFWTVILIIDFVCFAFLPWIQTRPPRARRTGDPWIARIRRLNLQVVGRASIQVNTFPSGHAAEALAATLLVGAAPWPLVLVVGLSAVLICAGAVLGRYHYAADALAGWVVAIVVWIGMSRW